MIRRDQKSRPLDPKSTADPAEIARFSAMAGEWWDPKGRFGTLHRLNPLRLGYILDVVARHFGRDPGSPSPLAGLRVLDIGCGGGLLCEPMAGLGADVVGIDASATLVHVARVHAAANGVDVDYRHALVEDLAAAGERFDVVLNTEVVEHVADVEAFLGACCRVLAPGGITVIATLNRTAKSLLTAKIAGEYVLRLLPKGTHDWRKFVTPAELAATLERNGVEVTARTGVAFNPLRRAFRLTDDLAVNYMAVAIRTPAGDAEPGAGRPGS